jgi:peptidoglycan/xylan/chitin deacetylase (PgdA/CDA1 family)
MKSSAFRATSLSESRFTAFPVIIPALFALFAVSCTSAPDANTIHSESVRYWKETSTVLNSKAMTVDASALGNQVLPKRADPKIVILMYHNLVYGRTGNEYNRDIYNFEHDLAFLRARFCIIDFHDLESIAQGKMELDTDAAIISFDDGDLSVYAVAYPLLRDYGIKATFFLIAGSVGDIGYMNWKQIAEMATARNAEGEQLFTFGSHSISHAYMGDLDNVALEKELLGSKQTIEDNTGEKVRFLALPFGSGSGRQDIIDRAQAAGYSAIRTSDAGYIVPEKIDLWRLPAIYIDNVSSDKAMARIWTLTGR